MAAQVNFGGTFSYPALFIPFDNATVTGATANVRPGMTVTVGTTPGADDLGRQRVWNNVVTTGHLEVGRFSIGVHDGELTMIDGTYLTVYDDYRVWAKLPYLDNSGSDVVTYKDGRLLPVHVAQVRAVANGGPGYAATIDPSTHLITRVFDGGGSFQFDSGGTTINAVASYDWDLVDGTPTAGATNTYTVTATFPAGFRWVKLTVTSDDGLPHTCQIPVFARDPDADVCIDHQISGYKITPQGQEVSLKILQDLSRDTYPDGTLLMLFSDDAATPSIRFIGWHESDDNTMQSSRTGSVRDTTMHFVDVAGRLKKLPGMSLVVRSMQTIVTSQSIPGPGYVLIEVLPLERSIPAGTVLHFVTAGIDATLSATAAVGQSHIDVNPLSGGGIFFGENALYDASPATRWDETGTANFFFYAFFLLFYHSTALELADFLPSTHLPTILARRQFHELASDESDLFSQVENVVSLVDPDHHLNCTRDGQLRLEVDPFLIADVDRPRDLSDIFGPIDFNQVSFSDEREPKIFRLTAYALFSQPYGDTALKCVAPGSGEGQGGQSMELANRYCDDFYIDAQTTFNLVEGNRYARANARHGAVTITVPFSNISNTFDLARMEYVALDVGPMRRNFAYEVGSDGIVSDIDVSFDYSDRGATATATITWLAETIGPPAVTVTPDGKFI
jgi:hypothetical protein